MRALGYLDAGSGSMLVSALVAGVAGIGVVFRMGWRQALGKVSPKHRAALRAERAGAGAVDLSEDPVETSAPGR